MFRRLVAPSVLTLLSSCTPAQFDAKNETPRASAPEQSAPSSNEPVAPKAETATHVEQPISDTPQRPWGSAESLEVPGFLDALVSLPSAREKCDLLMLATHGAGGGPEAHCAAWRAQLGDRGVIVCTRGALINRNLGPEGGYYYPDHFKLEEEVIAVTKALEVEYRELLPEKPWIYAGYSQGATMGALMLPSHGALFSKLILVEGGFGPWSAAAASKYRSTGGQRVAFVCGRTGCDRAAQRSTFVLERAEVEARALHASGAGHTYLGGVAERISELLPWLLEE